MKLRILSTFVLALSIVPCFAPKTTVAAGCVASNRVFRIDSGTSLKEVNALELMPGDTVLFRRGGVWRGQLRPRSGAPGRPVTYGAYGEGPLPAIQPSFDRSEAGCWRSVGKGLWMTETRAKTDIGNIVFNHGTGERKCAFKRGSKDELLRDLDFWCNPMTFAVWVRSEANPAGRFSSVELCEKRHCIDQGSRHDIVYENLCLRYTAAHGIGGASVRRVTVRGCDICWIGGGYLYFDKMGNGVRYGNGIEFWSGCEDVLVESNRVWECWDAGLTNQSSSNRAVQRNVTWRNNEVWNCEYSYEYWQQGADAVTENVLVEGNVFRDAGKGWGHVQRWNPNAGHLMFYDTTAKTRGFVVRNNVFARSENTLFRLFNDWRDSMSFGGNVWIAGKGTICRYHGRPTANLTYRYPDRLDLTHDDNQGEIEAQGSGACVFGASQLKEFKSFLTKGGKADE